jgi:uncharacterized membrane protein YphA (DoxX/SURF4 family)
MAQAGTANEDLAQQQHREDQRYLITVPVAKYYVLLVGIVLTLLGIFGFIPALTRGGALFAILAVNTAWNIIHLVTGLVALGVFAWKEGRYTRPYCILLAFLYLAVFSLGNITFADQVDTQVIRVQDVPGILMNAVHAGLMLVSALIFALAAMQRGDVQTEKFRAYFHEQLEKFSNERTRLPSA